jgi:2-methylaconitate cis-trans-isomerase PrpF
MGGGYSSVSKVVIVGKSAHPEADVDYTFAQVLVDKPGVDYGSNCGNMLAAVGPFALENALVSDGIATGDSATVRILNTNTNKLIRATFPTATVDGRAVPDLKGEFSIDGVAGTHARVVLDFLAPEGSRTGTLFPTGHKVEQLALPRGSVPVTLMDCGNPCVFVRAADVGLGDTPSILPPQLTGTPALALLDDIRNAAAVAMGLVPDLAAAASKKAVPKVCVVSPPHDNEVLSGSVVKAADVDLVVRCISSGDPHRALPITAALCTAAAAQVPGTIVAECTKPKSAAAGGIVIGHASGTIEVDADLVEKEGALHVPQARVFRTARKLFEGRVFA